MLTLIGLLRRPTTSNACWQEVAFRQGCRVLFPGRPTGKKSRSVTALGKANITHYRAEDTENRVAVILAVRKFGWLNPHGAEAHFDAWQAEFLGNMVVAGVEQSLKHVQTLPGTPATRELLFANPQESVFTRVLLTFHRRRLYILFAVGSTEAVARPVVSQCFQSFRLK